MSPWLSDWLAVLILTIMQSLEAAYGACGAQCLAAEAVKHSLTPQAIDVLYSLPDGTAEAYFRANGLVIRGM